MLHKIREYIRENQFIGEEDTVLVTVSGGADSVCLLLVLYELYHGSGVTLRVLHVNHQLRATALRDEQYVKELSSRLKLPFQAVKVPVAEYAAQQGLSTEEAARELRYQEFAKAVSDVPEEKRRIAVAHTIEDNAETVLFHLFRGSGLRGLGGIPPVRGAIIRPLLCVSRREIETFLQQRKVLWCEDETNRTDDYARNRIRHHILPQAQLIHPGAAERISESAAVLTLAEDYMQGEIRKAAQRYVSRRKNAALIHREAFGELHPYLLQRLLLEELSVLAGSARDISAVHVEGLLHLSKLQTGKMLSLPYGCMARHVYEGILLSKDKETAAAEQLQPFCLGEMPEPVAGGRFVSREFAFDGNLEKIPRDKYTKWFDCDRIEHNLCVRNRRAGDYLLLRQNGGRKSLKEYFINEKIPQQLRSSIPLLADGSHILWVVGYRSSAGGYVTKATEKVLEIHYEEGRKENE